MITTGVTELTEHGNKLQYGYSILLILTSGPKTPVKKYFEKLE